MSEQAGSSSRPEPDEKKSCHEKALQKKLQPLMENALFNLSTTRGKGAAQSSNPLRLRHSKKTGEENGMCLALRGDMLMAKLDELFTARAFVC